MDKDIDLSELDPKTIRFRGDELGVVTELPDGTSRLVLKRTYEKYTALAQLVEEQGESIIDFEMSASEVKDRVIELARSEEENTGEIPDPSGGNPYVLVGNTYPIRDTLKELGLRWNEDQNVWYTYDSKKWESAIQQLDATKIDDNKAKVPDSAEPNIIPETEETGAHFRISTDGACWNNPGPGGWAAIIERDNERREIEGREPDTTNNRMELKAIIEALRKLPNGSDVLLRSDSKYAIKVINGDYDANANIDLVKEARKLAERHDIEWSYVRGHSGDPENERADDLANEQAQLMHKLDHEIAKAYVIEGNTYPVKETLKEHGFEWNDVRKVWYTNDVETWREAVAEVGAVRVNERRAQVN